jgi:hypothetical protein
MKKFSIVYQVHDNGDRPVMVYHVKAPDQRAALGQFRHDCQAGRVQRAGSGVTSPLLVLHGWVMDVTTVSDAELEEFSHTP